MLGPEGRRGKIAKRLADARAGLCQHHVGHVLALARRKAGCCGLGEVALAGAHFRAAAGQLVQPGENLGLVEQHRARLGAWRLVLPLRQATEQPAFRLTRLGNALAQQRCPAPAQALQLLEARPRAFPLRPVGALRPVKHGSGKALDEERGFLIVAWRGHAERPGEAGNRGDDKLCREEEGEQLKQVEAGEVGVPQTRSQQWRIDDEQRRCGRAGHRFAPRQRGQGAIPLGQPDAGMARVECGGKWQGRHLPAIALSTPKGNGS